MDYKAQCQNCGAPEQGFPYPESRSSFCACSKWVLCLLGAFLALAIGLILGAVFAETILEAMAAVIVFAAVMFIAIIAIVVYRYCICCKSRRCQ